MTISKYPTDIKLLGRLNAPEGPALLLSCDNIWLLAYPNAVNESDRDSIDCLHSTCHFPHDGKILSRDHMPHATPLFGYDILHFDRHGPATPLISSHQLMSIMADRPAANQAEIIQLADYQTKH